MRFDYYFMDWEPTTLDNIFVTVNGKNAGWTGQTIQNYQVTKNGDGLSSGFSLDVNPLDGSTMTVT